MSRCCGVLLNAHNSVRPRQPCKPYSSTPLPSCATPVAMRQTHTSGQASAAAVQRSRQRRGEAALQLHSSTLTLWQLWRSTSPRAAQTVLRRPPLTRQPTAASLRVNAVAPVARHQSLCGSAGAAAAPAAGAPRAATLPPAVACCPCEAAPGSWRWERPRGALTCASCCPPASP